VGEEWYAATAFRDVGVPQVGILQIPHWFGYINGTVNVVERDLTVEFPTQRSCMVFETLKCHGFHVLDLPDAAEAPLWPPHVAEHLSDYVESGVALIWLVDPIAGRVTVHAPGTTARVLGLDEVLDGGDGVPGFRVSVAALVH
jgi:hypothetical protein